MKRLKSICLVMVLWSAMGMPVLAENAVDSAKYDAALDEWAAGIKIARERAQAAYYGLKLTEVQTGVAEGEMTRKGEIRHTYYLLKAKLVNGSDTDIRFSKAIVTVFDEKGKKVDSLVYDPKTTEVFAGTTEEFNLKRGLTSVWSDPKNVAIISGRCAIQIKFYDVQVHNGETWTKLNNKGEAFFPVKPRAPYYFTDEQIRIATGKAETKADVYDHPEKFAERPYYPLYGMDGSFSGRLPARSKRAEGETPENGEGAVAESEEALAKPINGKEANDEGLTMENAAEGVKSTAETVDAVADLVKSIGGLF